MTWNHGLTVMIRKGNATPNYVECLAVYVAAELFILLFAFAKLQNRCMLHVVF